MTLGRDQSCLNRHNQATGTEGNVHEVQAAPSMWLGVVTMLERRRNEVVLLITRVAISDLAHLESPRLGRTVQALGCYLFLSLVHYCPPTDFDRCLQSG